MKTSDSRSKRLNSRVADRPSAGKVPRHPRKQASTVEGQAASGASLVTHDGRHLLLRPIRPDDAATLRRAFDRLTPEQIRARFFFRMNELSEEVAQRLCDVDAETTASFVVTDADDVAPASIEIRAEARMHVDSAARTAEFALAVDPAFIGQGLGSALLQRLLAECRNRELHELWGDVLADNHAMLELVRHLDSEHSVGQGSEAGLNRVRLVVAPIKN